MNALWLSFRFLFFQIYIPNQNALLVSGFRRSRHLFLQFFLFIFIYMWIILNILPQNWAKLFKKSIFKMTITVFSIRNKLFPDCLGDELIPVFFRIQALGQVSRCLVKVTQVVSQCLGVLEGALWFRGPPSVRLRLSGWSSRHRDRLWLPPPPPPRPHPPEDTAAWPRAQSQMTVLPQESSVSSDLSLRCELTADWCLSLLWPTRSRSWGLFSLDFGQVHLRCTIFNFSKFKCWF